MTFWILGFPPEADQPSPQGFGESVRSPVADQAEPIFD